MTQNDAMARPRSQRTPGVCLTARPPTLQAPLKDQTQPGYVSRKVDESMLVSLSLCLVHF